MPQPLPQLDAAEQRVLGGLLEKQITVPSSYPLTVNALRTACNQSSSRDPVVDYDEDEVSDTLARLKEQGLVRVVWADRGPRTLKYHQLLSEVLELGDAERALLTVLLLRGDQAPGELRTRTERLHAFATREDVERTLAAMAERGLVVRLERRPGQQDHRWRHLLGDAAREEASPAPADELEAILAGGAQARDERMLAAYAELAASLPPDDGVPGAPLDRWLLGRVHQDAGTDPILDAGCGSGRITAVLASLGADARGIDLSPAMVGRARERHPDLSFEVADLRRVMRPVDASGWGGVVALDVLTHVAPSELDDVVSALVRVLRPGGRLLLGLPAGPGMHRVDAGPGAGLETVLHDPVRVRAAAARAALGAVEWYLRGPQPGEDGGPRFALTGVRAG